jgi:flagellar basal-body rod protein FlgC
MPLFDSISIAGSGVDVYRSWLDAVSDNLANLDTARPTNQPAFQARYIVAQSVNYGGSGGGAVVARAAFGDAKGVLVYSPNSPLADAKGYVRYPDIDEGEQMTQLIMAQRGYQANLAVVSRAQAAYMAAINVGRS